MKKIFFAIIVPVVLLLDFSGCYQTCESPFAVNYTLKGACIDLTAAITGTYNGQIQDSVVLSHSITSTISIQLTKMDDSHVIVTSSTNSYIGDTATVSSSPNGYYLTVPAQTDNGVAVSGAGTYFQSPADGIYVTATKQLTLYVLAGPEYEIFTGTLQ